MAHLEELLLSIRGENGAFCVGSDAAASIPKHKKKRTGEKIKTRLRVTKVNSIKAEKYERHPNARLHLKLTKKTPPKIKQLYQCPCDKFASRCCLSEEKCK